MLQFAQGQWFFYSGAHGLYTWIKLATRCTNQAIESSSRLVAVGLLSFKYLVLRILWMRQRLASCLLSYALIADVPAIFAGSKNHETEGTSNDGCSEKALE